MSFDAKTPLGAVLLENICRYPELEPRDAVKLIYQRNFGPGHFISDLDSCLARLRAERCGLEMLPGRPLSEPLGNGLARLNLNSPAAEALSSESIARIFMAASGQKMPGLESFRRELGELTQLCAGGETPFSPSELSEYLQAYAAAGFPPVSHSERYRTLYAPAYRVVSAALVRIDK